MAGFVSNQFDDSGFGSHFIPEEDALDVNTVNVVVPNPEMPESAL